ncbi:right-handed parallel beta-helix repeat-containing protein [bacterium]|nr:right-handed parallel beta-helix repeat-containing protein [bacterium]
MKKTIVNSTMILLVLMASSAMYAATIHVPSEQPDIQSGIDAALWGDTVLVADGVYTGPGNRHLSFFGKNIVLISENGPNNCTIDVESLDCGIRFVNSESRAAVFSGFKIVNGSDLGGAIYVNSTSPTIENCIFENNTSPANGGAIYCTGIGTPLITDCQFLNNTSAYQGGGIFAGSGSVIEVRGCYFNSNSAIYGGGIYIYDCLSCEIVDSLFIYNESSSHGGALGLEDAMLIRVIECEIRSNISGHNGGGVFADSSEPRLYHCQIDSNESSSHGGGIYLFNSSYPFIDNCLIVNNTALYNGGGICCSISSFSMGVSTVTGNDAGWGGNGLFITDSTLDVTVRNSIFFDNNNNEITVESGDLNIAWCLVQGGWPDGTQIIDDDPEFVEGADGDFYLNDRNASPCIDAGSVPAAGICYPGVNGNECMSDRTTEKYRLPDTGAVDFGYHYPVPLPVIIHIPGDTSAIAKGITGAFYGDTVLVADGTWGSIYDKNLDFAGRHITVMSENGPDLCIINCGVEDRAFHFHNGEGSESIVSGFTIYSGFSGGSPPSRGGAILCENGSAPVIHNIRFNENQANYGGAIACNQSAPDIVHCVFSGNYAAYYGGAIDCYHSDPELFNCLFYNNDSGEYGGGVSAYLSPGPSLTQCTLADNLISGSAIGGAGIYSYQSEIFVLNSIVYANDDDDMLYSGIVPAITYSDIGGAGIYPGTGNINLNPEFETMGDADYFLSSAKLLSPCIDIGSDLAHSICVDIPGGTLCMDELTTQTNSSLDSGTVDIGYHYDPWIFPTPTPEPTPTPVCINNGDVDESGGLTAGDAQMAFQIVLGAITPDPEQECRADCNADGVVTAGDAQLIFFAVLGGDGCSDPIT